MSPHHATPSLYFSFAVGAFRRPFISPHICSFSFPRRYLLGVCSDISCMDRCCRQDSLLILFTRHEVCCVNHGNVLLSRTSVPIDYSSSLPASLSLSLFKPSTWIPPGVSSA